MGEARSHTADSLIGSVLEDKYEILEKIGSGGMGAVYKAKHLLIGRIVAIKLIHASLIDTEDDVLLKRFEQEAKTSSRIEHPNAVTIHDYGISEGMPYLVMQFVDGITLKEVIQESGPVSLERTYYILLQVAAALEAAHSVGVVHRDLKPENIMLSSRADATSFGMQATFDGESARDWVEVLDFGIAKLINDEQQDMTNLTHAGRMIGTPHYLAPEQASGSAVDARTDVYALGVVLYEMLTGQTPYQSDSVAELLIKKISEKPRAFPAEIAKEIPLAVRKVVLSALEQEAEKRPQSAKELAEQFTLALKKSSAPKASPSWKGLLGMLGLAFVVSLGAYAVFRPAAETEQVAVSSQGEVEEATEENELVAEMLLPLEASNAPVEFAKESTEEQVAAKEVQVVAEEPPESAQPSAEESEGSNQQEGEAETVEESELLAGKDEQQSNATSEAGALAAGSTLEAPLAENEGRELYQQALLKKESGETDAAFALFAQSVSVFPELAEAHLELARLHFSRGESEEGLTALSKSLRIEPRSVPALILLGEHLESKGQIKRAGVAYQAAVKIDPSLEGIHGKLAKIYAKRGMEKKAKSSFKKELAVSEDDVAANLELAKIHMSKKEWREAIARYRAVLKSEPNNAEAFLQLGFAYNRLGRFYEGVSVSERAVELNPNTAAAFNSLALSYQAVGKIEQALEAFKKAISLEPGNDTYRANLANLEQRAAELKGEKETADGWSFF